MKKRVGICIGGGDCQGLNTIVNAAVKSLDKEYEIYGFKGGFLGLLEKDYYILNRIETSKIRGVGGTFLKTSNNNQFCAKVKQGELAKIDETLLSDTYQSYKDLGLDALIVIGGDATLSTAKQMNDFGFKIVGISKTIDNDLGATDFTFGFWSSVDVVTDSLERLHTTATSQNRVMVCEVMGRDAGRIALYGGVSGGADMVLLPEIPFSYKNIIKYLEKRDDNNQKSTIIIVSEGAKPIDGENILKTIGGRAKELLYGGIGDQIARYINTNSDDFEARSVMLGHIQRGGAPVTFDRILCTQYGSYAGQMVKNGEFGKMVAYIGNQMNYVDLDIAVRQIKHVEKDSQLVKIAKDVGINFGDEGLN